MGCSINIGCISECIDEEIRVMFTLNALGPINGNNRIRNL